MNEIQKKRFYSKIQIPYDNMVFGCWEWIGRKNKGGRVLPYGVFDLYDKGLQAHRVSYLLWYGKYPDNCACHSCDNPSCVNPLHLFDATHDENMKDKKIKNRVHRPNHNGIKNQNNKLSEEQVLDIRQKPSSQSHKVISKEFNVSRSTITLIMNKKIWKHI